MFVTMITRRQIAAFSVGTVLVLLLLGGASLFWVWLNQPFPPPTVGIDATAKALVAQLFEATPLGDSRLDSTDELLTQLHDGQIDYLVELGEPTPGLLTWPIGQLVAALIVPFFDQTFEISNDQLRSLLESEPEQVLVSDSLALPGFPWSTRTVQYLPSANVIDQLSKGQGKLGVIPLQDRSPSVRVLPLAGVDPRQSPADDYLLTKPIFLSRRNRNLAEQLKGWNLQKRGGALDELLRAAQKSPYANPWGQEIKMVAAGDIMLDRDVKKVGLKEGWEHIFDEVAPFIRKADISFANLESPIGDKGHFINMFQAPPEAINGVVHAGFDVVTLANNHTLDYHHAGMFETIRLLEEHGIDWVGAGNNIEEARSPLVKNVGGVRIGFLAYTEMWFVHAREPISWKATEDEPGVAPAELEYIIEDVQNLRDLVDVLIVTVHWGKEYTHEHTPEQQILARAAVDAGADLVLGHHPHVLQGIEFYKQGMIAYSLGNFVFDLNLPKTWDTMLLEFTLSPAGVMDMTIVPAHIFGVQPRLLEGYQRDALYRQIRNISLSTN